MARPRYKLGRSGENWLVLDRLKIKMHNDVVATFHGRQQARDKVKELNDQDRRDHHADKDDKDLHAGETI